jgi:DNA-binding transcriptional ArsR family regulator
MPSLVVAPTSVAPNWIREAERFVPGLKTVLLHGLGRHAQYEDVPNVDLVITTYALLRRDVERLRGIRFRYVILDEAQQIKNHAAATTAAAKSLPADARLALTGTPIENRLLELWSILDFVNPGMLGSWRSFSRRYERPVVAALGEIPVGDDISRTEALALLDVFIDGGPALSLAELTRRTRLVKPTVLRLLLSLESAGYVNRLDNGQYQLGAKVMQLGTVYRTNFALDALVLPVLRRLTEQTQETGSFHVKEGNKRVCLFRAESPQPVRAFLAAGTVHPMDDTASGLVLQTYHKLGAQTPSEKLVFQTSGIRDAQTASISTPACA